MLGWHNSRFITAGSGVNHAIFTHVAMLLDVFTGTGTGVGMRLQGGECFVVGINALTLIDNLSVPLEAKGLQGLDDTTSGPWLFTWLVDVFDAE